MDEAFKEASTKARPRRSRRSWSDDEKGRIVAQALAPGASVADVARQHGLNANLVFNWVRSARSLSSGGTVGIITSPAPFSAVPATSSCDFIPLGVFAPAPDRGPPLLAQPEPIEAAKPPATSLAFGQPAIRPGLIEIDLANGTRLRVDASVDQHALQRVMSVLMAAT